ncbi:MAG TPA: hypothetical protein VFY87_20040, partial [Geminicoccaceae bacterium]|nr:hypothetical protein [Geminicoccaceae bacterium]
SSCISQGQRGIVTWGKGARIGPPLGRDGHPRSVQPAAAVAAVTELAAAAGGTNSRAAQAQMARLKGYVGDPCSACGNFTLVRNGTCLKCDTCGSTTGCS